MSRSLKVGGIFIVAGTTIGAGMLALPLSSYSLGFIPSAILMIVMWVVALSSALVIAKINIHFGKNISIPMAAQKVLGKRAAIITSGVKLLLLYSLLAAYISGGGSILFAKVEDVFSVHANRSVILMIFTLIFGGLVAYKFKAVDYVNRLLCVIMISVFITMLVYLSQDINLSLLGHAAINDKQSFATAILLFFTSFGFQLSIHAIVQYVGNTYKQIKSIFIIGTLIPLIIYIIWQVVSLGVIPLEGIDSFSSINSAHGDIGVFVQTLTRRVSEKISLSPLISWFTLLAIVTSFLGVAAGLFEYFIELFKYQNSPINRLKAALWTFTIPTVVVLLYPQIFIQALTMAAAFLSIVAVVIPALIALKLKSPLFGNRIFLQLLLFIGIALVGMQAYIFCCSNSH